MTRSAFKKLSFFLVAIVLSGTLYLSTTYATLAPLTPPPSGGYDAGTNSILDPGCAPTDTDCFVKPITADNGLTATGSNVQLGGTLIQDTNIGLDTFNLGINTPSPDHQFQVTGTFKNEYTDSLTGVVSTIENSGNLFGFGVPAFVSSVFDPSSNLMAFNFNAKTPDNGGTLVTQMGVWNPITFSDFFGVENSTDISGISKIYLGSGSADGAARTIITRDSVSGTSDTRIENSNYISGFTSAIYNDADAGIKFYSSSSPGGFYTFPRTDGTINQVLSTDGAGQISWVDGGWSLTGNAGTIAGTNFIGTTDAEDFMVKTNGNQIALFGQNGNVALGSEIVAFSLPTPIASGIGSLAAGGGSTASGMFSTALGLVSVSSGNMSMSWGSIDEFTSQPNVASGDGSTAFGEHTTASGLNSTAWGARTISSAFTSTAWGISSTASGYNSTAFGNHNTALSLSETVFGSYGTSYISVDDTNFNLTDRLVNIGNGTGAGFESDAFTILKNGETGIGIDNFEANTNGNIFQVGDGATNIIGYVDDVTGNWVAVSDERKKENITDLSYGLDQLLQLRPTSFDYKRNHEHTIGFIAQQVLPIIPEAVYGTENEGYGMSYATLTPVIVKSIQEMNLKITDINNTSVTNTWRDALIGWLADAANGITKIFAGEVETKKLCVSDDSGNKTCITKNQLDTLLNGSPVVVPVQLDPVSTPDPGIIDPETSPEPTPDPGIGDQTPAPDPTPDPGVVSPTE